MASQLSDRDRLLLNAYQDKRVGEKPYEDGLWSSQGNKDFAIAYDRFICLRDGGYNFSWSFEGQAAGAAGYVRMARNGTYVMIATTDSEGSGRGNMSASINLQLKRGDYVQFLASYYIEGTSQERHTFSVTRI